MGIFGEFQLPFIGSASDSKKGGYMSGLNKPFQLPFIGSASDFIIMLINRENDVSVAFHRLCF